MPPPLLFFQFAFVWIVATGAAGSSVEAYKSHRVAVLAHKPAEFGAPRWMHKFNKSSGTIEGGDPAANLGSGCSICCSELGEMIVDATPAR